MLVTTEDIVHLLSQVFTHLNPIPSAFLQDLRTLTLMMAGTDPSGPPPFSSEYGVATLISLETHIT